MTVDSNNTQMIDYEAISQGSEDLYKIVVEYLKLKERYNEPQEAELLRKQAERVLIGEKQNFDAAKTIMTTALKIMKACYKII